ncbi:hypothetical protein [Kitasatospora sp. NPDC088783]|uniref:hypothetical protein n=1 Tax=Kitasatospora sp. NPDC088783 TaxID=3364077 RepID=UPI003822894A
MTEFPLTIDADSPWLGLTARDREGVEGTVARVYDVPHPFAPQVAILARERGGRALAPRLELVRLLRSRGRAAQDASYFRHVKAQARLMGMMQDCTITARGRARWQELGALVQPYYDVRALTHSALLSQVRPGDTVALVDGPGEAEVLSLNDVRPMAFPLLPQALMQAPLSMGVRLADGRELPRFSASMLMPLLG